MLRHTRINIDKMLAKICLHPIEINRNTSTSKIKSINYLVQNGLAIREPYEENNKIRYTASVQGLLLNSKKQKEHSSTHPIGIITMYLFITFISFTLYATSSGLIDTKTIINELFSFFILVIAIGCSLSINSKLIGFIFRNIKRKNTHKVYALVALIISLIILSYEIVLTIFKLILPTI